MKKAPEVKGVCLESASEKSISNSPDPFESSIDPRNERSQFPVFIPPSMEEGKEEEPSK